MELVGKLLQGRLKKEDFKNASNSFKTLVDHLIVKGLLHVDEEGSFIISDRVSLVEELLLYGFTVDYLANLLTWKDFELFTEEVLARHGYSLLRNFRFSRGEQKFEVDLLALRKPLILCVECKHYRKHKSRMISKKSIERHLERTMALATSMDRLALRIGVSGWGRLKLVPLIITVAHEGMHKGIPIVPVFKFNTFLLELDSSISLIHFFEVKAPKYSKLA